MKNSFISIFGFVLLWLSLAESIPNELIVELPYGQLFGRDNGFYNSYTSIPYAEPPIGALRFEAPRPFNRQWKGLFDATNTPVACMQWSEIIKNRTRLQGAEDCLTVNIYTPRSYTTRTYPVVVAIHGGAFMFGSVAEYHPRRIMSAGNAILVSISYRVGPLGFLSAEHKDLSGNYGLKDQRLALEWIRKNIAYFGGEPQNIVLVGQSAGGASVNFQLLKRDSHDLVRAAASISGVALNPWAMQSHARERAFAIGDMLNCPHGGDALQLKRCLQSKPAEDIVSTVQQFQLPNYGPFTMFGPVIEDAAAPQAFLTQHPRQILQKGEYSRVPYLVTYTKEDGGSNAATLLRQKAKKQKGEYSQVSYPATTHLDEGVVNKTEIIERLNYAWLTLAPLFLFYENQGPTTYSKSLELRKKYLGNRTFNLASYSALEKMFTDVLYKDGVEEVIKLHSSHGNSPIYAYLYDNPAKRGLGQILSKRNDIKFGTVHGDDYLQWFPVQSFPKVVQTREQNVLENFFNMFANFARSGQLQFGTCQFVDNANKSLLQLMNITRDACENLSVTTLP